MKGPLVGIGEVLWDVYPGGRRLGGAPANFVHHVCGLGRRGVLVSRVGTDAPGRDLLEELRSLGRKRDLLQRDPAHPTGSAVVHLDDEGAPVFEILADAAWDHIEFTRDVEALADKAAVVCYGTLAQRSSVSRDTILRFVGGTRDSAITICDLNLRGDFYSAETIRASLAPATVVKASERELREVAALLSLPADVEDAMNALMDEFEPSLVAVTRGRDGSLLLADGELSVHNGFDVDVVDTVGAGDTFTAALAVGLLDGLELDALNRFANRVASYVCTQRGATPDISRVSFRNDP